jgi:hypothetical protein
MTLAVSSGLLERARGVAWPAIPTRLAQGLIVATIVAAGVAGALATDGAAAARAAEHAGPALARLLRGMAALKAMMAAGVAGAVVWRLGAPVTAPWLAAYAVAGAAMTAGPGLIWGLTYVGMGAAILHAGLGASVILLWRDPAMARRLAAVIGARRAALAGR